MNIATDSYTNEELLKLLTASTREVTYEYIVASRTGEKLGSLNIIDGHISYNSTADVMRTFKGSVRKEELINLKSIDFQLMPYMCLKVGKKTIKWSLGKFLINPSYSGSEFMGTYSLTGYDFGKIALDDKLTSRFYAQQGAPYTSLIGQLLGECYGNLDIPTSDVTKAYDQEWESGTSRIDIANTLLEAIGYTRLYFDEVGTPKAEPYIFPQMRQIDRSYETNSASVILDNASVENDSFSVPNKFVRYTQNVDAEYMIATYINDKDDSPFSVQNRGRTIVDSQSVNDIASQQDLNNYVQKIAIEKMQSTERLTFRTLNMPGHGYKDCLIVNCEPYGIYGKYIETAWDMDLSLGGTMTHTCERVMEL